MSSAMVLINIGRSLNKKTIGEERKSHEVSWAAPRCCPFFFFPLLMPTEKTPIKGRQRRSGRFDSDWALLCGSESDKCLAVPRSASQCLAIRCLGFSQPALPLFVLAARSSLPMPRLGGKGHHHTVSDNTYTSTKLIFNKDT